MASATWRRLALSAAYTAVGEGLCIRIDCRSAEGRARTLHAHLVAVVGLGVGEGLRSGV